jgi:predicted PurR-regulated permease PerM
MSDPPSRLHEFALRVLAVLALTALALFLWRIVDVLLLVFGAGLLAILLHAAAEPIRRHTRLSASAALGVAVAATLGPQAARLAHWAAQASGAVFEAVLVAFGGVYLAADPWRYRSGLLKLFPPAARGRVGGAVDAATHALRRWLLAQLVVMVIVGTLTGVGMWLIGMPSPLALGLLAGLLEFVPFVGPIVAAVPGLLLALTVGPLAPLYALAVYLVVQQIESNLVTPLVARHMLALPPAVEVPGEDDPNERRQTTADPDR